MKCKAKTRAGKKCKNRALPNTHFCRLHLHNNIDRDDTNDSALLFSDALYYPFIEIASEEWLKTAVLYWNTLSTIVPRSISPYRRGVSKDLSDAGVLQALVVDPDMPELDEIADDVIRYIYTEEGQRALLIPPGESRARIHDDKLSRRLLPEIDRGAYIHVEKFASELLHDLRHVFRRSQGDAWVRVPSTFASYYMTVLASRLARTRGRALLTDQPTVEGLATKVSLGTGLPIGPRLGMRIPTKVAEGLLATLALRTVRIGPKTSVRNLLSFIEKHETERSRFRSAIRGLVNSLRGEVGAESLLKHVQTIFQDELLPSLAELRARLHDHRITCGFSNLKLSTLASTSPTVVGGLLSQAGLGPFAFFAGVGLSIVLQTANYTVQRRGILRENPYSFVLSAEKIFGKTRK